MDTPPFVALDDVAGRIGTPYAVAAGEAQFVLTLDVVEPLPDSGRAGGSFRLEFKGPAKPILPQGIYRFSAAETVHEIFIVPIASDPQGTRYEAVFY